MFEERTVSHLLTGGIIIVLSYLIGRFLRYILNTLFQIFFSRTQTTLDDRIIGVIRAKVTVFCLLLGVHLASRELSKGFAETDVTALQLIGYLNVILFVAFIVAVTHMVSRIVQVTFEWYVDEVSRKTHTDLTPTVAPLTTKIVNTVLFLIAGMILLDHFGINIGSLLISLGVGSLAVALAAQETIANMIAGFVLLIDQPFRVGDRIRLQSGEEGDVYQIGLRSTRILNYDNNLVVIPNAELVKNRIVNFAFPEVSVRVLVEIGVNYGVDIERVKGILLTIARKHPDLLQDPPPAVYLVGYGESAIQLNLVARTPDYRNKFLAETALRAEIYKAFTDAGIEFPIRQHVIQVGTSHAT